MKRLYYQQMHKKCGGEIIFATWKRETDFVCKTCGERWSMKIPINLPTDWTNVKDGTLLFPSSDKK